MDITSIQIADVKQNSGFHGSFHPTNYQMVFDFAQNSQNKLMQYCQLHKLSLTRNISITHGTARKQIDFTICKAQGMQIINWGDIKALFSDTPLKLTQ